MKVLHICNHFWPSKGGIEKFVFDLCRESKKIGVDAEVLCLNKPHHSKEVLPPISEVEGIRVTRVPFLNLKYYKPALLPLNKLREFDVLHVHGVGALLDFVVLTKGIHRKPIVVSTHGGVFHTKAISGIKKLYFFGLQKMILKGVDKVVACSRNDLELFKPISNKMVLIENGAELDRFSVCDGVPKQENVFLFVGRLSKNKQIDRLLPAFGKLHKMGIRFTLRIVGSDWEGIAPRLQELSKALGIAEWVFFAGEVSDEELVSEYCAASFFVSASRYEGFGISAIEAMACGCVPILNRISAFEYFVKDGVNGFLLDFSDSKQTAKRIQEIMQMDMRNIRKSAQNSAQQFDWSHQMKEWDALYARVGAAGSK